MKIQEKDFYHGAALMQIVEHKTFKATNSHISGDYGHYLINTDRHVFVKYRTGENSPWQHTLSEEEIGVIADLINNDEKVWLCLVCGDLTICALDSEEIGTVVDLDGTGQQWVKVAVPRGGSCHVTGSNGALRLTVPHNSFPGKIFA